MLGAGIPPALPSAAPSSGDGQAFLAVIACFIVVALALAIGRMRRARRHARVHGHDVTRSYNRAA